MPAFFARWPNGDCAVVVAGNRDQAFIELDEIGDEPAEIWRMPDCLMSFALSDSGTVEFEGFGYSTAKLVLERGYPALKALEWDIDPAGSRRSRPPERVRQAVATERSRHAGHELTPGATVRSRRPQKIMGGSGRFVDYLVRSADRLRDSKSLGSSAGGGGVRP
jgi:hypothetical protein